MNLNGKSLKLVFLAALFQTLIIPVFFPYVRIDYFIPFIIVLMYNKQVLGCMWGALGCGWILDLLSPHARLGINAITYTLAARLIYRERRHFFADSLSTLPLMTFFFSVISSLIQFLLISIFERGASFTIGWALTDLLLMPSLDALFSFSFYILPFVLFGKPVRKGKDYFLQEN